MFERYTEKARRVIFFARYEASQFGSPYIETEHLRQQARRFLVWLDQEQRAGASILSCGPWRRAQGPKIHQGPRRS